MLVVAQIPLWLPIVMHVFAPARIERIQGFADRGVQQIGGRTGAVVVGCVGGLLVLLGSATGSLVNARARLDPARGWMPRRGGPDGASRAAGRQTGDWDSDERS